MGFDSGNKSDTRVTQQMPDFKASLETYYNQVGEISIQIKARSDELAEVLTQLSQAKKELQTQYSKKVESLGIDIAILQSKITELQAQSDTLSKEIRDKQNLKEAISTDNITERQRLNDSWAEFHIATEEYLKNKDKVAWAEQSLLNANAELEKAKKEFVSYKAITQAGIDQQIAESNELLNKAKEKNNDALDAYQSANKAIDELIQKKAEIDAALRKAEPIVARADEIQLQAEKNIALQVSNDAMALQNQKDADQIRVTKIALHNKEVELNGREATITAAEHKIGG